VEFDFFVDKQTAQWQTTAIPKQRQAEPNSVLRQSVRSRVRNINPELGVDFSSPFNLVAGSMRDN
jgi:hypothetical protein